MKKCKYHKTCIGYRQEDYTCQSDYEAHDYCGYYKEFERIQYEEEKNLKRIFLS